MESIHIGIDIMRILKAGLDASIRLLIRKPKAMLTHL